MKRLVYIYFLLALYASVCYGQNNPAKPQPGNAIESKFSFANPVQQIEQPFKKVDSFNIYTVTDKHLAFPDVTKLPDGRFLLVYREGKGHVDSTGKIMCQYSFDGYKWSDPQVFYDDPLLDDRDPSVSVMPDSTVGLVFFKYKKGIKNKTPNVHHLYYGSCRLPAMKINNAVQLDAGDMNIASAVIDGNTWKTDKKQEIKVEAVSSKMIAMGTSWIIPAYGGYPLVRKDTVFVSPASRISLFISNDHGKSFKQQLVNPEEKKDVYLQEPSILALDDNNMIMQVRTATKTPYAAGLMMQAQSGDGGKTWSAWTELPVVGHAPFLYKFNNYIISAFRMLNTEYTKESTAFMTSGDQGKTWSAPQIVEDCGENECGYPSIVSLSENKFLMVYYGDDGKTIKGAVYEMRK